MNSEQGLTILECSVATSGVVEKFLNECFRFSTALELTKETLEVTPFL